MYDPFFSIGASMLTGASILFVPICLAVLTLYGRFRAFRAMGMDGWKGAVPWYCWYALGKRIGGDMTALGLILAIVEAVSIFVPVLWLVSAVLQFILLSQPGKDGGFAPGLTVGCILLPSVFWFSAARRFGDDKVSVAPYAPLTVILILMPAFLFYSFYMSTLDMAWAR